MNQRLSLAAATAALAVLPLLAACGGATATRPAASTAAPTATTATEAAPSATSDPTSTSGPSSPSASTPSSAPTSSATSSFDKVKESQAVSAASEKFANAVFSLGYPATSTDAYFKRMRPLTTDRAYVEVKEGAAKSDFTKLGKQLTAQRSRSASSVKGDVTVVSIDAGAAQTAFQLQVAFQQRSGGGWKTSRTSPAQAEKLELVKQHGTWLVDHLPAG